MKARRQYRVNKPLNGCGIKRGGGMIQMKYHKSYIKALGAYVLCSYQGGRNREGRL